MDVAWLASANRAIDECIAARMLKNSKEITVNCLFKCRVLVQQQTDQIIHFGQVVDLLIVTQKQSETFGYVPLHGRH